MRLSVLCLLVVIAGCSKTPPASEGPASPVTTPPVATASASPVVSGAKVDPSCGVRPSDWCASPAGDPCGAHQDVASCRADARCKGMKYRGESVVACKDDGSGFATNCPTVGCLSR